MVVKQEFPYPSNDNFDVQVIEDFLSIFYDVSKQLRPVWLFILNWVWLLRKQKCISMQNNLKCFLLLLL